jgi:hypothetical protein
MGSLEFEPVVRQFLPIGMCDRIVEAIEPRFVHPANGKRSTLIGVGM